MKVIKSVGIRRSGGENDPNTEIIVEIQYSDGEYMELGRENISSNFSHWWNVLDLQQE